MLDRLIDYCYRRRRLVVIAWMAVLVATTLLGGRFGGGDSTDYGTPGSESAAANDLLDERFPARSGDTIDVVWRASDVTAPPVRAHVEALLDHAAALEHVVRCRARTRLAAKVKSPPTAPSRTPPCSSTPGTCRSR